MIHRYLRDILEMEIHGLEWTIDNYTGEDDTGTVFMKLRAVTRSMMREILYSPLIKSISDHRLHESRVLCAAHV